MTRIIKRTLQQHEELIESGMKGFLDVGSSLIAIRDEKLYAEKHETFEDYCKVRWGFSRPRAYQFIEATETVSNLSTIVDTQIAKTGGKCEIPLPANEAQARAVADVSDDPKQQAKVWKAAVAKAESSGKPVTAATVKAVAAEVLGEPQREPGDDGDQPEHDETIEDAFGPVCKSLRQVFAARKEFTSLIQQIGGIRNDILELQKEEGGAAIEVESVRNLCKELKAAVKFAAPYCECPKCKRSESQCDMCNDHRWIPELVWSRNRTEEWEAWLKGDRS